MTTGPETTDLTLFVRTSGVEAAPWNRQRIVDALLRETGVDYPTAEEVSREVEKQIVRSGITRLTTTLVRELVDARLLERGLEQARGMHSILGFPVYNVRQLLIHENKENANVPHTPEGTNLILAEGIKRDYALHEVFGQDISDAHIAGDIHLHDLGYIDRPQSSWNSLEYLKIHGLDLPHAMTVAHPARHAEVLLAHMVRFSAVLQGLFGGLISWNMVNYAFAPYLSDLTAREVEQIAQMLVYEFSQLTSTRGGQTLVTEIHLHWSLPSRLADTSAIGPGGKLTGKTYGEYQQEARRFATAIFEVFRRGDARGRPFIFPQPVVHVTAELLHSPEAKPFLDLISAVALEKGNPCFSFDREEEGLGGLLEPAVSGDARRAVIHHVSINLPRLGYRVARGEGRLLDLLDRQIQVAVAAHVTKRTFVEKLLSLGEKGPLAVLAAAKDGQPYLSLDDGSYLIGMVGLNELVQIQTGEQLDNGNQGVSLGLEIVRHLAGRIAELSREAGLRLRLVQTETETTSYRFARLDLKYFSPLAGRFVRGDIASGGVYYSNSTHLPVSSPLGAFERIEREGRFHPFLEGGGAASLYPGEKPPPVEVVQGLLRRVFQETEAANLFLSPEFTICLTCGETARGLHGACPSCQSETVDRIARITRYFSRTSQWNSGKLSELADRKRWVLDSYSQ